MRQLGKTFINTISINDVKVITIGKKRNGRAKNQALPRCNISIDWLDNSGATHFFQDNV